MLFTIFRTSWSAVIAIYFMCLKTIRLNSFISKRFNKTDREARNLILQGYVTVDGLLRKEVGFRLSPASFVEIKDVCSILQFFEKCPETKLILLSSNPNIPTTQWTNLVEFSHSPINQLTKGLFTYYHCDCKSPTLVFIRTFLKLQKYSTLADWTRTQVA